MGDVRHYIGVDLGQVSDFTAIAVLEQHIPPRWQPNPPPPGCALRHVERVPLGTAYPGVVERVLTVVRAPGLADVILLIDGTGVGRGVVDLLRSRLVEDFVARDAQNVRDLFPMTITAGQTASRGPDGYLRVPKKDLVGALQLLLQARRLQIAASLSFAETLVQELQNYRVEITQAGNETFNARAGEHDDLVLAVAMAAWFAEMVASAGNAAENEDAVAVVRA